MTHQESGGTQESGGHASTDRCSCHACRVPDDLPPPDTRRARLWTAAESRNVPLRAILVTVAVVVVVYIAAKLIYRLRDVILLMIVAGFVALILNPLVLTMQHLGIRRRGLAVSMVTLLGLLAFAGLALAFGYPLVNGITDLAHGLPSYVSQAEHGKGWLGHLVRRYHVQAWVRNNAPKLVPYQATFAGSSIANCPSRVLTLHGSQAGHYYSWRAKDHPPGCAERHRPGGGVARPCLC